MQELSEIQQLYNKIPKQVIAKFTTQLSQYQIDAGEIDIPTEMDESECNKLLKNFLQNNLDANIIEHLSFQFLVGGRLLRGQLKSHIIRYQISCEQTLRIQYFLAFEPLESQKMIAQDDWVSTLQIIRHPVGNCFAAALFSGVVNFYSQDSKELLKCQVDQDAIKSIVIQPAESQNSYYTISGGLNEEIRIGNLKINDKTQKATFQLLSTQQVQSSILAIDINPIDDGHFCVAGSNGQLSVYKIPENFESSQIESSQRKKKKKVHLNQKSIKFVASEKIHSDQINSLSWISQNRIVTGSSDHTLKMIDVETLRSVGSVLTKDSITTSIDYVGDRLLTSHEDGYIRMWDIRSPQTPSQTYKAHSKLVSSVQFNARSNIFASGSYDTTIKIWDYRSGFPIQNLGSHHDKVFSVLWKGQNQLLGGGSDSQVSVHNI